MESFEYTTLTKVFFGKGKISLLNEILSIDGDEILFITDQNLVSNTNIIKDIKSFLPGKSITVFDQIEENPSYDTIDKGGQFARDLKADIILGIGGGSCMDAAKGIALIATNSGNIKKYIGVGCIEHAPLPLMCIPTTSGTGSEVTPFAVFTDYENETKSAIVNDRIFPLASIIDPELTFSMPEQLIINTGLDALSHSIEAYLSKRSSDLIETISLRSVEIIVDHLQKADGKKHDSMEKMAYASMLGGMAISNASTILPHIMGYPLTFYNKIPHGRAGMIMIPAYLKYLEHNSLEKEKLKKINQAMIPVNGIDGLLKHLGVSAKLSDYGVSIDDLKGFVKKVIIKDDIKITPGIINEKQIHDLYMDSL